MRHGQYRSLAEQFWGGEALLVSEGGTARSWAPVLRCWALLWAGATLCPLSPVPVTPGVTPNHSSRRAARP